MRLNPCLVLATVMSGAALVGAAPAPQKPAQKPAQKAAPKEVVPADEAAALKQFDAAIVSYMALRQRLRDELPGPVPNSTAPELTSASDALAAAIQRARAGAKVGNIFAAPVTVVVKHRVEDVIRRNNLDAVLADIDDESPTVKTPSIHLRFPAASQMATMPPTLLAALPELPRELEYRIIGEYLILRDVDAALILDYIPGAVRRKP